jgi:hypothetical protein
MVTPNSIATRDQAVVMCGVNSSHNNSPHKRRVTRWKKKSELVILQNSAKNMPVRWSLLMDSTPILLCSVVILVWLERFQSRVRINHQTFLTWYSHQTHRRRRWNDPTKQVWWRRPQPAQRANVYLFFFHLALAVLPKGSTDQQQKVDKISFIISSRFLPSSNGQDPLSLQSSTAADHPLIHQPTSPQASPVHPVHTLME